MSVSCLDLRRFAAAFDGDWRRFDIRSRAIKRVSLIILTRIGLNRANISVWLEVATNAAAMRVCVLHKCEKND